MDGETTTQLLALAAAVAVFGCAFVPMLLGRLSARAVELLGAVAATLLAVEVVSVAYQASSQISYALVAVPGRQDVDLVLALAAGLAVGAAGVRMALPLVDGDRDGDEDDEDHDEDEISVRPALALAPRRLFFAVAVVAATLERLTPSSSVDGGFYGVATFWTVAAAVVGGLALGLAVLAPLLDGEASESDLLTAAIGLGVVAGATFARGLVPEALHAGTWQAFAAGLAAGLAVPLLLVALARLLRDVGTPALVTAGAVLLAVLLVAAYVSTKALDDGSDSFGGLSMPAAVSLR